MMRFKFIVLFLVVVFGSVNVVPARADGWDYVPRRVRVPILMYHYVSAPPAKANRYIKDLSVSVDKFAAQLQWLKEQGYTSVTPDDLLAALWHGKPLPPKPIMFTFDDGYVDAYANAFPLLKQYGFTGTFFVITDWVDQNRAGYINWDMARAMVQGGMYVESHSRNHEDFRDRSHDWYHDQIDGSIQAIQAHTGVRPRFFCYPFGGYDDNAIRELEAVGIEGAFTENDSRYEYASNTMRLPRVRIRGTWTLQQFIRVVTLNR